MAAVHRQQDLEADLERLREDLHLRDESVPLSHAGREGGIYPDGKPGRRTNHTTSPQPTTVCVATHPHQRKN